MPLIKRYPNRKLYDTEAKQYVTLDQIAEMIRGGAEIQVVDNATGEDLTAITLTQIIFEQEKKQGGFLPRSLLSGLIQTGGDRLSALQRTLAGSIGLWHQVEEEIKRRIRLLIEQGDLSEGEGQRLIEKLLAPRMHPVDQVDLAPQTQIPAEEIERYLAEHQVPTRADLQRLLEQLDTLEQKIEAGSAADHEAPEARDDQGNTVS